MNKTLPAVLAVVAVGTLSCGPAGQSPPTGSGEDPGTPRYGGVLNVEVTTDPWDWDISYSKSSPNDDGIALAYDSLLTFKTGQELEYNELIVQPKLAERWEVSPDARSFTFHLRKGVKFQDLPPVNGRELTSADVKFTFEYRTRSGQFKDKKLPQGEVDYIFEGLERIETPDPYTVVVHFKAPFIPFVNYAASDWNPILPREIYDQDGHFRERMVGAGAYILDTAATQKGSRWVWKKNPRYWDSGKPYLDEIRWLVIPHDATAQAAFQTKQLDILDGVEYQDAQTVTKGSPQALQLRHLGAVAGLMYFSMVPARGSPLQDVRLRRAMQRAVDRDEINRVAMGGQGEWGVSGAFHGLFTEAEARQLQKQDPEEARRLVIEAGYPNGVSLEWPVPGDTAQSDVSVMELLQAQLKKAGINIDLVFLDRASQRGKRRSGDFDIDGQMFPALGLMHDDPDSVVFGRLFSKSRQNYGKMNDPEVDRLVVASRAESDPEKRREIMRAAARRVTEMAYTVALLHGPSWDFWQPHVMNFKPNFGSQAAYEFAWLGN